MIRLILLSSLFFGVKAEDNGVIFEENNETLYIELWLVADYSLQSEFKANNNNLEEFCHQIGNHLNGLFEPINIKVALSGIKFLEEDEVQLNSGVSDTSLRNFLQFRSRILSRQHPNDVAILITNKLFNQAVLGKTLIGGICSHEYSGGISFVQTDNARKSANLVAHQIGHTLKFPHDNATCCPNNACIMAKFSQSPSETWSNCSKLALKATKQQGLTLCLQNRPSTFFKKNFCGNGFVEEDEQCDCGLEEHCSNPCCEATSCKLKSSSTCGSGLCCNLKTCKLYDHKKVCRSAKNGCDLPEVCSGTSKDCPEDKHKENGLVCQDNDGYCYDGQCGSRQERCSLLYGPTGRPSKEKCYSLNLKTNRFGNCGYNKFNQTYEACKKGHELCGRLFCQHETQHLHYGFENTAILSKAYVYVQEGQSVLSCFGAVLDGGSQEPDLGLVPDGAQCGQNKMCVQQTCKDMQK